MKVLRIALALAIVAISSLAAQAKVEPTTAYMFGFASSFNDSTVYITSVQKVDSVYLSHKNLFRPQLQEGREKVDQALRALHQENKGQAPEERRKAKGTSFTMAGEERGREQVHLQAYHS